MNTTFLKVYMNDGTYYCIDPDQETNLTFSVIDKSVKWITLSFAAMTGTVTLRTSEIQSFYISTPESRKQATEWEKEINKEFEQEDGEDEPWKSKG